MFVRCQLSPEEMNMLGVDSEREPSNPIEPQQAEICLDEGSLRSRVSGFINEIQTVRIKTVQI